MIEIDIEERPGDPHEHRLLKRILRNQEKTMAQIQQLIDEAASTQSALDTANTNLTALLAGTISAADSDGLLVALQGLTAAAGSLNAAILAALPPPPAGT